MDTSLAAHREIRTLQALRAGACLMVVVYHALQAGAGEGAIRAWPNGSAGVDLFFVISGFVMVTSSRGLAGRPDAARVFWTRRLQRIVPLYWLLTAAKLSLTAAAPGLTPHTAPDAWNVAASLMFIPARDAAGLVRPVLPVGWTLNFEMLFYALFAGALALRIKPLCIAPALAALAIAGFWRTPLWPAPAMLANGMVLEFAAGMAIAEVLHLLHKTGRTSPALAPALGPGLVLALSATTLLVAPSCGPWRFLAWGGPATIIATIAIVLEPALGARLPRWLLLAGDASFAIYLLHPFVVAALAPHGLVGACAAVPVSVLAGMALHRFVDAPMQRLFRHPPRLSAQAG